MKTFFKTFLISSFVALASAFCASAQEAEEFTADRPGATTGPTVLPKGRVQLETGFGWERSALEGPWATTWTVNTSMLRWGFSDMAELRLQANYLISKQGGERDFGFDSVFFGTKARLHEGGKIMPAISLMANVMVPGKKGSAFLSDRWGGQMGLLFENTLAPWCSLGYEADLIWNGYGSPEVFFGACLGFQPWERLSIQVEEYNIGGGGSVQCWSELSLGFQAAPRLQIDLASDLCLSSPDRYGVLMVGLSWQITKR